MLKILILIKIILTIVINALKINCSSLNVFPSPAMDPFYENLEY